MKNEENYEFYIAGRMRNKDKIQDICNVFDNLNISYYCFFQNEHSHQAAGLDVKEAPELLAQKFENLKLESQQVRTIFEHDMEAEKKCKNFLLVLPAGKSSHIEAGIAYGWGKKCYAIGQYDVTDSLYLIFDKIFADKEELEIFLKNRK